MKKEDSVIISNTLKDMKEEEKLSYLTLRILKNPS